MIGISLPIGRRGRLPVTNGGKLFANSIRVDNAARGEGLNVGSQGSELSVTPEPKLLQLSLAIAFFFPAARILRNLVAVISVQTKHASFSRYICTRMSAICRENSSW